MFWGYLTESSTQYCGARSTSVHNIKYNYQKGLALIVLWYLLSVCVSTNLDVSKQ
jgi:hypothetical protein